jgi:hypothetical protein
MTTRREIVADNSPEDYQRMLAQKLDVMEERVREQRRRADASIGGADRGKILERLAVLEALQQRARRRLAELEQASEDTGYHYRHNAEEAWRQLESALNAALVEMTGQK